MVSLILLLVATSKANGACTIDVSSVNRQIGEIDQLKISIALPAETADKAVSALAKLSGQALICASPTADEIVLLRAKSVTIEEVKSRLAKVLEAKWVQHGDKTVLERPSGAARKTDEKELIDRGDRIAAAWKNRHPEPLVWTSGDARQLASSVSSAALNVASAGGDDSNHAAGRLSSLRTKAPIGRALSKLLRMLDGRVAAGLDFGDVAVMASNPTQMERNLPSGSSAVLEAFNAEQNSWGSELERQHVESSSVPFDPRFGYSPDHGPATRLILKLRRWEHGDAVQEILSAVDERGWILAQTAEISSVPPPARSVPATTRESTTYPAEGVEFNALIDALPYYVQKTATG